MNTIAERASATALATSADRPDHDHDVVLEPGRGQRARAASAACPAGRCPGRRSAGSWYSQPGWCSSEPRWWSTVTTSWRRPRGPPRPGRSSTCRSRCRPRAPARGRRSVAAALVQRQALGVGHEAGGRLGRAQQFGVHDAHGTSLTSSPARRRGIPATTPIGAAVEVRGSRAGQPRRLPAQSRRAPPRCSGPRSRLRGRRNRRPCTRSALGSHATPQSTCPHAEHRWLVNAGLIFSTRPGALSSSRRTSSPQPDRRISRFSPAFCRTFRPGCPACPWPSASCSDSQVLDPDHVEPARDVRGGLLGPVLPRICLAGAQPRHGQLHPCSPVRPPL